MLTQEVMINCVSTSAWEGSGFCRLMANERNRTPPGVSVQKRKTDTVFGVGTKGRSTLSYKAV